MDECKLRAKSGTFATHCDGEECIYWRALDHLGTGHGVGCAIQHFELLDDDGVAAWLLTVKERYERVAEGV